jgi:hypothetical protein
MQKGGHLKKGERMNMDSYTWLKKRDRKTAVKKDLTTQLASPANTRTDVPRWLN